ncbi:MAG TPA: hypothetical protein VKU60_19980, partial [Chloroflexota bacterium]|nr:hypothetical protein [Chloroflexota bacterium]
MFRNIDDVAHQATIYFARQSQEQLVTELVPIRKSLHRGTESYISVAYGLAYFGIDVDGNFKRMLSGWFVPDSTAGDLQILAMEGEPDEGLDAYAMDRIYARFPSGE